MSAGTGSSERSRRPDEIAMALRSDFAAEFQRQFDRTATPDPVLATMFQALAVQIGRVYREADDVFPWQVLDDLMAGLAMPRPEATPAQTIVAFSNIDKRERISGQLRLQGKSPRGEPMFFIPDASIELSPTSLAFAAVAEDGRLRALPGATLPGGVPLPPVSVPCSAASGHSALLLAFEGDRGHLSGLGLRVDTGVIGSAAAVALARSPWYVLNTEGIATEAGVMRGSRGPGGMHYLEFDDIAAQHPAEPAAVFAASEVGTGPYGEQVWLFPVIPAERQWRGAPPARFVSAIESILPDGHHAMLESELVWVYVPLPAGVSKIATMLNSVTPNAVTASNLELAEERVSFSLSGTAVALRPEGQGDRYLMRLVSVSGESGSAYVPDSDLEAGAGAGRVRVRGKLLELRPAQRTGSRYDGWAKVRMLLCDGPRANGIEPNEIRTILDRTGNVTLQVHNIASSRGGASPPDFSMARLRFAELLRTRERVVTVSDFEIAARAYDSRIESVMVDAIAETTGRALQPVDLVRAVVSRSKLSDPDADRLRIEQGLQRYLSQRGVIGRAVRVQLEVEDR